VFKIDPPYPEQTEQFMIKLKKDTHYKDKETQRLTPFDVKYRVKLYEKIGVSAEGKPLLADITKTKMISNGSVGVAMYDVVTNKYGTFAKLKAVRVDELIEYNAGDNVDELGEVVEAGDYSTQDEPEDDLDDDSGGTEQAPFDADDVDY
jgi:hypothetical protein